MRALFAAVAFLSVLPTAAAACRIPYRFDPAHEHHDVVAVAVAVSQREADPEEQPQPSSEGIVDFPVDWIARLETVSTLRGEAPQTIEVRKFQHGAGMCWDGIETPMIGGLYAVYLDHRGDELVAVRMISFESAQELDPVFGRRDAP